jgi:cysteinyl-tRNA synthetase
MSGDLLGFPFDIHTGGIDHREIHHPNEIAQNQAHCCTNGLDVAANSGANVWMHNTFLVERSGKMSKSSGEFLRLQLLIDRGYHPLAYRMMCLQAHYRSELEFSWEGLEAALVRLKRMVIQIQAMESTNSPPIMDSRNADEYEKFSRSVDRLVSDDLDTPSLLAELSKFLSRVDLREVTQIKACKLVDQILGLNLLSLTRDELRTRPKTATITEPEIDVVLTQRKEARAAKDFITSDRLRDELSAKGVEVMDGDPLGWDWKLG